METEFHEPSLRALPPVVLTAEEAQESVEAINIITVEYKCFLGKLVEGVTEFCPELSHRILSLLFTM